MPADEAEAAAAWLRSLPGKWAAGLQRSQSLAPWLVHNAALTGWRLDLSLRLYLTRTEPERGAVKDHGRVLAHRIMNMQDRAALLEPSDTAADTAAADAPKAATPQWCGNCCSDDYRWIAPEAGPASRCPDCNPIEIQRRARRAAGSESRR